MATPMDLIDAPTEVMTYGGIADATTAYGLADERAEWCGAFAAYIARAVEFEARRTHRRLHGDRTPFPFARTAVDLKGERRPGHVVRRRDVAYSAR